MMSDDGLGTTPPSPPKHWWRRLAIGTLATAVIVIVAVFVTLSLTRQLPGSARAVGSAGRAPGASSSAVSSSQPPGGSWLGGGVGSGGLVFIQWTDTGGHLSGVAQVVTVSGSLPNESTSSSTIPLAGTLSGSTIAVSFNGHAEWFGTISGDILTLNARSKSGALIPQTLAPATAAAYNDAFDHLTAAVNQSNSRWRSSQRQAGMQQVDALCGTDTLTCPQPPWTTGNYQALAVFDPATRTQTVTFSGRPLAVCFAISPGSARSVGILSYEIGQPIAGPTIIYGFESGSGPPSGYCVGDPGNDAGPQTVTIFSTGAGNWVVQIDQATTYAAGGG